MRHEGVTNVKKLFRDCAACWAVFLAGWWLLGQPVVLVLFMAGACACLIREELLK